MQRTQFVKIGLLIIVFFQTTSFNAQVSGRDAVLAQMHKRLLSSEKRNYHKPFIFVGEISELGSVFQGVCKVAVDQKVDFSVSRVVWGNYQNSVVHAGYINCSRTSLPSPPFTLHSKVIVYCEQSEWLSCLYPIEYSDETLGKIESWTKNLPPLPDHTDDAAMGNLRVDLLFSDTLARRQGFVFVGEVSRNEKIQQKRCASGTEQVVEYGISEVLWNDAAYPFKKGDSVRKGFIDCAQQPLAAPFIRGKKVIVYCEAEPTRCITPVQYNAENFKKVQLWVTELTDREGNPQLLQIHNWMRNSLELDPRRPMLLFGQVTWITPEPKLAINSITVRRYMRVRVSRLLWGFYKEREVQADCPSRDCSDVTVGAKVIVYCHADSAYYEPPPECPLTSADYSDENVHRVEDWVAQAREHQRQVIFGKISQSLEHSKSDTSSVPHVYRGYVKAFKKNDEGLQIEQFVETAEAPAKIVNLLVQSNHYVGVPVPFEIGKPIITFCYQQKNVCYSDDEFLAMIEDSDQTYHEIKKLISNSN